MNGQQQAGGGVSQRPAVSGTALALWFLAALVAHAAVFDAAVETYWFGSALRWWLSPLLLALVLGSAWLWRPGGRLRTRFHPSAPAATAVVGLLALLALGAWSPGGQTNGVRMGLQPTPVVLAIVTALAVLAAAIVTAKHAPPASGRFRTVLGAALGALTVYALAALALAAASRLPYEAAFRGGSAWQALPRWFQGATVGGLVIIPVGFLVGVVAAIRNVGVAGFARAGFFSPTALLLAFTVVLSGFRAPTAAGGGGGTFRELESALATGDGKVRLRPAEAKARVQFLVEQFQSLRAAVPRQTFDPASVVASVGRDPEALFRWVRDKTYFVPYRGALRGPTGVLMDRLGNSLDRSLLLADLLGRAGLTTRLAHAMLPADAVATILAGVRPVPSVNDRREAAPDSWAEAGKALLGQYCARFQCSPADLESAATLATNRLASEAAQASAGAHAAAATLLGQLRDLSADPTDVTGAVADHWWVQFEADGRWVECDPIRPDASIGTAPQPAEQTMGLNELPEDAFWSVSVHVIIERWRNGALSEVPVLAARVRPVDSFDRDLVLTHVPSDGWAAALRSDTNADSLLMAQTLRGVSLWTPVLDGAKLLSQATFSVQGDTSGEEREAPRESTPDISGGVLGEETATGNPDGILTAEWIDYEITGPGAEPKRIRRESFDLVGPAARQRETIQQPALDDTFRLVRALMLFSRTEILCQAAEPSAEFMTDRVLRRLGDTRAFAALQAEPREGSGSGRQLLNGLLPSSDALWKYAARRFELSSVRQSVYLAEPSIATLKSTLFIKGDGSLVRRDLFDIVSNHVAVHGGGNAPSETRLEQGVADTAAEREAVGGSPDSTLTVFREAAANGIPVAVLSSSSDSWQPAGLPDDVAVRARSELSEGVRLVVPSAMISMDGRDRTAWWRVDVRTGATVGVMDTGFHQATTENSQTRSVTSPPAVAAPKLPPPRRPPTAEEMKILLASLPPPGQVILRMALLYRSPYAVPLVIAGGAMLFGLGVAVGISLSTDDEPPPRKRGFCNVGAMSVPC